MAFNPDEYLKETSASKEFDPDAYLSEATIPESKYDYSNAPRDLLQTNIDALPMYGAALGGVLGMGVASVPFAGAGAAAGESLKNGINSLWHGEQAKDVPKTPVDILNRSAEAFAQGAASEVGGQVVGKGIDKAIGVLAPALKSTSESMAARALGAERSTVKKLGQEKINEIGRYALDNNVITPFASTDDLVLRNNSLQKISGSDMGQVYSKIDDAGIKEFNPLDVAAKVDDKIGGFYRSPINRGETNQLENTLESILLRGDKNISLREAQSLKEELGKVANWKNNLGITDKERMAREAYGVVSNAIDEAVNAGSKQLGSEEFLGTLTAARKNFSNSKGAEELLNNKVAREQGNKLVGLTDAGFLGAGGLATVMTGGTVALPAIGAYGIKKYAEKFGPQQTAIIFDGIAKNLLKNPGLKQLSQSNPKGFSELVTNVMLMKANNLPQDTPPPPPKSPYEIDQEIKDDPNLTPSQKMELRKQNKKGR